MLNHARLESLRPWTLLGTAALAVVFLLAYRWLVYPQFDYLGYHWQDPNPLILTLTIVGLLGITLLLPVKIEHPSDFMVWLIFLTVVLPVFLMSNVMGLLDQEQILETCFWTGGAFAFSVVASRAARGRISITVPKFPPKLFWLALGVFTIATVAALILVNGFNLNVVGLTEVYEIREEFGENLAKLPILAYLIPTLAYIVLPLIMIRGLHTRSWTLVAAAVGTQVFVYLQSGFKIFLLGIPVILLLSVLIGRKVHSALLSAGLTLGIIASAVVDEATGNILATSLFTRRFLATPGQLATNYIDFFDEHSFVLLSEGVLRGWSQYPYDLPVPFLIGRVIHDVENNSSNVNFLGDGFAQGGWLGVVLAGLVFTVLLIVIDLAATGLPPSVAAMMLFLPCIVLGNASILTAMLSHGIAAGVIVLFLAPRDGWVAKQRPPSNNRNLLLLGKSAS